MRILVEVFLWFGLLSPAVAQTSLGQLDLGNGTACCMAVDSSGNTYVAGGAVVAKFDSDLKPVFRFAFGGVGGSGYYEVKAIALDDRGNIFVAGETSAPDFPLVHPIVTTSPGQVAGFVAKVNAAGNQLLFSTLLGGAAPNTTTGVTAMAADANGDIYLAGYTSAADYPATPNAYQRSGPAVTALGTPWYGFVTKLSNSGDRILYSTFLGDGAGPYATGGQYAQLGYTRALAIAVGADGNITVAGVTSAPKYPVTQGAVQTECRCGHGTGFVSRLAPDLSALRWSTFLGGSGNPSASGNLGDQLWRLAVAPNGDAVVAGFAVSPDFPVTPGAFQSSLAGVDPSRNPDGENAVIARIDSSGTRLEFSTYFGGSDTSDIFSLGLDAGGHPWVSGYDPAPGFAVLPGSLKLGADFLAELSSDGTSLLRSQRLPGGMTWDGLALDASGGQTVLGVNGSILRLPPGESPGVIVTALANAAVGPGSMVAPGEIVSLYGAGLGPVNGAGTRLDSTGKVATQLAGTQVLFDGTPAPLLYAGDGQINAIVPFGVSARPSTFVEVRTASGVESTVSATVVQAAPGLFADSLGNAVALNEDGTVNSPSHPAVRGSIITFWANGAGLLPSLTDGSIVHPPLPVPGLPVSVKFDYTEAGEVLYAGAAPGMVAGVLQVNVRIPVYQFAPTYMTLWVGGFVGGTVRIATR
jgi:uncharacterized protein (TIGR03437 family)